MKATARSAWVRGAIVQFGLVAILICLPTVTAQQRGDPLSSAVDTKGVRHRGSDYVGPVPWMIDAIKKRRPDYPYNLRARHIAGSGLFRVTLDVTTGCVNKVAMIQSTGTPALDESAMEALRQWQWKPGKWKEIDVPITFAIPRR
jgi:TonB family protein